MKKINLIYWIMTGLFAVMMLYSGISEMLNGPESKAVMDHLHYPDYLSPFIGFLKVLGIIVILIPAYPGIKEWAYAGFFFDLTGATFSQIAMDGINPLIFLMLLPYAFLFISYYYFHKKQNVSHYPPSLRKNFIHDSEILEEGRRRPV